MKASSLPVGPPLLPPPGPRLSRSGKAEIQLVAVTQKTAERSYRGHIEQQIQTYQRRWGSPHPPACIPTTHASFPEPGDAGRGQW